MSVNVLRLLGLRDPARSRVSVEEAASPTIGELGADLTQVPLRDAVPGGTHRASPVDHAHRHPSAAATRTHRRPGRTGDSDGAGIAAPNRPVPCADLLAQVAIDGRECMLDQLLRLGTPAGEPHGVPVGLVEAGEVQHFMQVRRSDILTTVRMSTLDEAGLRRATCWVGDHCSVVGIETVVHPVDSVPAGAGLPGSGLPGTDDLAAPLRGSLLIAVIPNFALPHLMLEWVGELGGEHGPDGRLDDGAAMWRRVVDPAEALPHEALQLARVWKAPWRSWQLAMEGREPLSLLSIEGYGVYDHRFDVLHRAVLRQRPSGLVWGDIVRLCTDVTYAASGVDDRRW